MSKVSTIPEVLDLPDDAIIHAFKGTITKSYPRTSGQGEHGEWSYENLIVMDSRGDKIKVTLKDREPFNKQLLNKCVYFLAFRTEKHGWKGVKSKDDSFNGQTERVIVVTKVAEVLTADEYDRSGQQGGQQDERREEPQQRQQSRQQNTRQADNRREDYPDERRDTRQETRREEPAQQRQQEPTQRREPRGEARQQRQATQERKPEPAYDLNAAIKNAKQTAGKVLNLYELAVVTADFLEARAIARGKKWDMDMYQSCVSSVFITLRNDYKLDRTMPAKPIEWSAKPAPATEPERKPEPPPQNQKSEQPPQRQQDERPPAGPDDSYQPPEDDDVPF